MSVRKGPSTVSCCDKGHPHFTAGIAARYSMKGESWYGRESVYEGGYFRFDVTSSAVGSIPTASFLS